MTIDVLFKINISPEEMIDKVSFGFQSIGYVIAQRDKTRVVLHYKASADLVDYALVGIGALFASSDNIISLDAKERQVRIIASGKVAEAHAIDLIRQLEKASLIESPPKPESAEKQEKDILKKTTDWFMMRG